MLCACVLGAGCGSTSASVGRATSVLLVLTGERGEQSEAGRAVRSRVAERDDLELASMTRLAALAAEEEDESTEAAELEAERRLTQAEEAFSNFDYTGATTALQEALDLLRPLARRATGRRRLGQLHLELAMILQVHGQEAAALEEIRTCQHIDPDCAPDPVRHPPELLELHRSVVEGERPTADLRVTTDPEGARVTLDGRREASAPTEWDEVPIGRHYVTIEKDGYLPEVRLVNVVAGEASERSFALTEGPPAMRASAALRALQSEGPDADPLWRREAATLTEADTLLVLDLDETLRIAAFDGRGAALGDPLTSGRDDAGEAQSFLDEVIPAPSVPWYGQWWFWTPVAFTAAILLAGLTFFAVNVPDVQLVGGGVEYE